MPQVPIIMPQLGESIAEATIVSYLVKPGDNVEADQDIIEVETNKANMNVAAPCKGRIAGFSAELNESYPVGAVLGQIEVSDEEAARLGLNSLAAATPVGGTSATVTSGGADGGKRGVEPTVRGLPVPATAAGAGYMSPRMKARMNELGLHSADLAGIAGSGAAGRVTVEDFEKFLTRLEEHKLSP